MLFKLVAFTALTASSVAAAGSPVSRAVAYSPLRVNPVLLEERSPLAMVDSGIASRALQDAHMTNAERLARGLPLKAPHRRKHNMGRSVTSSVTLSTKTGTLQVKKRGSDEFVGYVSKNVNQFREYGVTLAPADALQVKYSYDPTKQPSQLEFTAITGTLVNDFPIMGAVKGFTSSDSSIGPGRANYLYVAGVTSTPKNSGPQLLPNSFTAASGFPETVESAIWGISTSTGKVSIQWINSEGTVPTAYFTVDANANAIIVTGDLTSYTSSFGTSHTPIDIYFVVNP